MNNPFNCADFVHYIVNGLIELHYEHGRDIMYLTPEINKLIVIFNAEASIYYDQYSWGCTEFYRKNGETRKHTQCC